MAKKKKRKRKNKAAKLVLTHPVIIEPVPLKRLDTIEVIGMTGSDLLGSGRMQFAYRLTNANGDTDGKLHKMYATMDELRDGQEKIDNAWPMIVAGLGEAIKESLAAPAPGGDEVETIPAPLPKPEPVQLTQKVTSAKATKSADGLTYVFSWDAVPGATSYDASYQVVGTSDWKSIADVKTNSHTIETAKLPTEKVVYGIIAKNELGRAKNPNGTDAWSDNFEF